AGPLGRLPELAPCRVGEILDAQPLRQVDDAGRGRLELAGVDDRVRLGQPPAAPADLVPLLVALDRLVALLARRGMAEQRGRRLARDVGRAGALGRLPALAGREGAPVLPARTLDRRSAEIGRAHV